MAVVQSSTEYRKLEELNSCFSVIGHVHWSPNLELILFPGELENRWRAPKRGDGTARYTASLSKVVTIHFLPLASRKTSDSRKELNKEREEKNIYIYIRDHKAVSRGLVRFAGRSSTAVKYQTYY
jgi:hypothetical protein